ncbi:MULTISPECIES: hypothetical protein [unclassified Clostridium]|uniref:hypothetical protein n=1 Tax=unclassified Clostridium TaxID=2614128 RepID=UPI001D9B02AF|nr:MULTISPECIES: hypothetical protein [unclassified Clostridium]MBY7007867.1 hypothetical protein [Clostridium botulinum]
MNDYRKLANKTKRLTGTLERLADLEDKEKKGEEVSESELCMLMGKLTMQIIDLEKGL